MHRMVIDEYGAMVEWSVVGENRRTWVDKHSCNNVHHKSHLKSYRIQPGSPRQETSVSYLTFYDHISHIRHSPAHCVSAATVNPGLWPKPCGAEVWIPHSHMTEVIMHNFCSRYSWIWQVFNRREYKSSCITEVIKDHYELKICITFTLEIRYWMLSKSTLI
jgi:hypothetical protein